MYIADGDYIRDIEINDLRNRYTLTKGLTQKQVITPCVIHTDSLPATSSEPQPGELAVLSLSCEDDDAYYSNLILTNPSLHLLTMPYRLKTRLALVRFT